MNAPASTDLDLTERLTRRGALLSGHFQLSSGRHSDRYVRGGKEAFSNNRCLNRSFLEPPSRGTSGEAFFGGPSMWRAVFLVAYNEKRR